MKSRLATSIESLRNLTSVLSIRSIFSSSLWTTSSLRASPSVFFLRALMAWENGQMRSLLRTKMRWRLEVQTLDNISFFFLFCSSMSFCFSWKAVSLDALSLSTISSLFGVVVAVDEGSSDVIAAVVSEADTSGSVDDVADSWGEGGGGLEETTSQVPLSTKRKYKRGKVVVVGR